MRLTSYNIAVRSLNAGACLSDLVSRMWGYMEEGDVQNAECVRQKAILLDGLINALNNWSPTIESGHKIVKVATVSSGSFSVPMITGSLTANGITNSNDVISFTGGNLEVMADQSHAVNCFLSPNDDSLQVSATSDADSITVTFIYDSTIIAPIVSGSASIDPSPPSYTIVETTTEWTDTPCGLTNEELLSVLRKIDEICVSN